MKNPGARRPRARKRRAPKSIMNRPVASGWRTILRICEPRDVMVPPHTECREFRPRSARAAALQAPTSGRAAKSVLGNERELTVPMPCVGELGVPQPADDVGQFMFALILLGEAEAAPNVHSVDVALIAVRPSGAAGLGTGRWRSSPRRGPCTSGRDGRIGCRAALPRGPWRT